LLQSITEQLNEVSTKIDSQKGKIGLDDGSSSTHNLVDNIFNPFFKMDAISKQNEEAFVTKSKENASLLKGITDQLKELETSFKGMKFSCVDKTCQNTSSSSSSSEEEEEDGDGNKVVSTVQRIFNKSDKELPTINKLKMWNNNSKVTSSINNKSLLTCFKCKKLGHKATNCNEKQKVKTLITSKLDFKEKILTKNCKNYYIKENNNLAYYSIPIQTINTITSANQKTGPEIKSSKISTTNLLSKCNNTKEIQTEIKKLKT